jgi:hypothetical protein
MKQWNVKEPDIHLRVVGLRKTWTRISMNLLLVLHVACDKNCAGATVATMRSFPERI